VEEWVDKAESLISKQGCEAWQEFAGQSCDGSAGLGHRLTKPLRVWEHEEPDRALQECEAPLEFLDNELKAGGPSGRGPDARAEYELRQWEPLWEAIGPDDVAAELAWPETDASVLPPITVSELRAAARCFKRTTGLGPDNFHPRWIAMLSDEVLLGLAALLAACEAEGRWPRVMGELHAVFIPKDDGGVRPILLYATTYRVWAKCGCHLSLHGRRALQSTGPSGGAAAARPVPNAPGSRRASRSSA
jgi:hypothetical protein